ncbi:hypothetical protein [Faecalimicrobium dakarense]|uniref:hypothetical protein n=1 Tax=Faecalimicrobium dakarense TaxID=1301100 RepID=UPI0004B97AD4|nr:hypothetical protein [[Clostridium] dakarense]
MNNKLLKKVSYILIALIQVSIISSVFIVQYLTNKKAGVMRHVYARRYQFEKSILTSYNLNTLSVIALIITFIFIVLLIKSIKNNKNLFYKIQIIISIMVSLMICFIVNSNYFIEKLAYPYFIMAFILVLILQIIVLIVTKISNITDK